MKFKFFFTILILNVLCHRTSAEHKEVEVNSKVPEAKSEQDSVLSTIFARAVPHNGTPKISSLYNASAPNFWAPGRRVSEVKCYEYIWQLKNRDVQAKIISRFIQPLVLGGVTARGGEYPNMAALGWKSIFGGWTFECAGTLISPNFVLTAAHCSTTNDVSVDGVSPKIVRLGVTNIEDVYVDVEIDGIIVHPNYTTWSYYFDIALMELKEDVRFNKNVQPACLWTHPDVDVNKFSKWLKRKVTVSGWGVLEYGSSRGSPELQAADLDVIDSTTCDHLLTPNLDNTTWFGLKENQICAGKLSGGVDTCQGDSGGPLQVTMKLPVTKQGNMNYIIGVTSFGVGCALPNMPGVYTRVSSFLDWIESHVWPEEYKLQNVNFQDQAAARQMSLQR